jgi:hypothetical protein
MENETRGILSVLFIIVAPLLICYWFMMCQQSELPARKVFRNADGTESFYVNSRVSSLAAENEESFLNKVFACKDRK